MKKQDHAELWKFVALFAIIALVILWQAEKQKNHGMQDVTAAQMLATEYCTSLKYTETEWEQGKLTECLATSLLNPVRTAQRLYNQ